MNDKKKVLIITYYWPPSGGSGVQRWVKFCKYLPDFGIEPIVLTVENGTYPLVDATLEKEIAPNLNVYTSKSIEPYSLFGKIVGQTDKEVSTPSTAFSADGSLLKKFGIWVRANFFVPDARIGWIPLTVRKASKIIQEHNIDTVVTTGPPNSTHLIGLKLTEKIPDLKWIMDMRDPWTQVFYNQVIPRHSFASKKDLKLEKKALKRADEVIVVSESMKKVQEEVLLRKYEVLTNGFDHTDFSTPPITKSDKFEITYTGSMTEAAIPYSFFEVIKLMEKEYRDILSINFYGSINEKVKKIILDTGLGDIINFHEYIPHLQAKKKMQEADLLLLVIPKTDGNELIMTGKIFDYIGAQKNILCLGPKKGDAAKIIEEYKLGYNVSYDEKKALQNTLEELIKSETNSYKPWSTDLKSHPFSRYSLTKKLSQILSPSSVKIKSTI